MAEHYGPEYALTGELKVNPGIGGTVIQTNVDGALMVCLCGLGEGEIVPEGPLVLTELCSKHQALKLESLIERGLKVVVNEIKK